MNQALTIKPRTPVKLDELPLPDFIKSPRPLAAIIADLSQEFPKAEATRRQGGQLIRFIPWQIANKLLDRYAPGWSGKITATWNSQARIFLVYEITIPTADGFVTRSATGTELLNCGSYGDPSSNAESMAFRRAAARFGLGLYLYAAASGSKG